MVAVACLMSMAVAGGWNPLAGHPSPAAFLTLSVFLLSLAFVAYTATLGNAELAEAESDLQQRVEARTADLTRATQRLEQEIAAERAELSRLHDQRQARALTLTQRQQERQQLLARLQEQMRSKGTELEQLTRDEQRLQELVRSLRELLSDIPAAPGDSRPFPSRKGKLDWPVQGSLVASFGSRRAVGDLTWRGILIRAPRGAEVRAVSHGRVAFADWLRGFGLLIIVDHGDGYMTLYGHNQGLYKEAGEWVETGEVIAGVGDGGDLGEAGLYFEVRHKGRPVNPASWMARR
jgi:septal ring factor EnvC (AmiA/AmiB activator)